MRIKLDENIEANAAEPLIQDGHDCSSVAEQNMSGWQDPRILTEIAHENRCVITWDLDFANVLAYPPSKYAGIVVLRHKAPSPAITRRLLGEVAVALRTGDPKGKLWIMELGRMRVHDSE